MLPKEKAKELVVKFSKYAHWDDGSSNNDFNSVNCAIIAVDVILNDVGAINWESDSETGTNYWLDVKKELESF